MIPVTLAQLARDCDGQVVGTPTTEILDPHLLVTGALWLAAVVCTPLVQ